MLSELLRSRRVVARHKHAPFTKERERYLACRAEEGCSKETLIGIARELFHVAEQFREYNLCQRSITLEEITKAAEKWAWRQYNCGRSKTIKWPRELFLLRAKQWFRFLGCLIEPAEEKSAWYASLIEDFSIYMEQERGLSQKTIRVRCWHVEKFFQWWSPKDRSISSVRVTDIDRFLTTWREKNWSRVSIASSPKELRAFFRYAAKRQWCHSSIAQSIEGPRLFKDENVPSGPSPNDIRRLIKSMQTNTPKDIRDRAIVTLIAVYGLRSGEVSNLRLDDIDWEHCRITIRRNKQRNSQIYPLVPTVESGLIEYLQSVRPHSLHREIFLTFKAPIKPLSPGALHYITSTRIQKLGISTVPRGPHSLRHMSASYLLSEGFSLEEIGGHLGHRSASATRIYAKVDLPHLREVAAFNFGGAL